MGRSLVLAGEHRRNTVRLGPFGFCEGPWCASGGTIGFSSASKRFRADLGQSPTRHDDMYRMLAGQCQPPASAVLISCIWRLRNVGGSVGARLHGPEGRWVDGRGSVGGWASGCWRSVGFAESTAEGRRCVRGGAPAKLAPSEQTLGRPRPHDQPFRIRPRHDGMPGKFGVRGQPPSTAVVIPRQTHTYFVALMAAVTASRHGYTPLQGGWMGW